MNPVLKQLKERKSVRVFQDRPITAEETAAILEAAVNAPTAGNQQLYTIIQVTDSELKAKLAESCDHQPFIATAPLVLVFCADCRKWYKAFADHGCNPRKPGVGDLLLAVNRPYGRADYLPCIAWGSLAALCGSMDVGTELRLEGRLQSRAYRKVTPDGEEQRVAYEISVMNLLPEEEIQ